MSAKQKAPDSPGTPSKKARKVLTLEEKINIINAVEGGSLIGQSLCYLMLAVCKLITSFTIKTLNKQAFWEGMSADIKYLVSRNMQYPEIDEEVWEFFCQSRSKCIPINGPMLQSKANKIAMKHNYNNITASNGWLKSFCVRH